MEKLKKKSLKAYNGITLIALVITIIVLLILAGISIAMLAGDNSILSKAGEARDITGTRDIEERIQIAYLGVLAEENGNVEKDKLQTALENEFGSGKVTDLADNLSTVKIDGKTYNTGVTDGDISDLEKLKKYFIGKTVGEIFNDSFQETTTGYLYTFIEDENDRIEWIGDTGNHTTYWEYNGTYYKTTHSGSDFVCENVIQTTLLDLLNDGCVPEKAVILQTGKVHYIDYNNIQYRIESNGKENIVSVHELPYYWLEGSSAGIVLQGCTFDETRGIYEGRIEILPSYNPKLSVEGIGEEIDLSDCIDSDGYVSFEFLPNYRETLNEKNVTFTLTINGNDLIWTGYLTFK